MTWNDTVLSHPQLSSTDKLVYHLLDRLGGDTPQSRDQLRANRPSHTPRSGSASSPGPCDDSHVIGADDLLLLFVLVAVRGRVPGLYAECRLVDAFVGDQARATSEG